MQLAIFDLDHTLVPMDTGDMWVRWLLRESERDPSDVLATIDRFTREYRAGTLRIEEFMDFQLRFLASFRRAFLDAALAEYVNCVVRPAIGDRARALIARHRDAGHRTVICTATYSFVTEPIARLLGVDALLASRPSVDAKGELTGTMTGPVTFAAGKVTALQEFLTQGPQPERLYFYSDSCADLPLFDFVEQHGGVNCVLNGESELVTIAHERGWAVGATFDAKDLERTERVRAALSGVKASDPL